ncbi:MAG: HAD family hydrolase [Crocosphaera sp.]|jgi:phosphoglycolate phosphatase-like HAD superfamily hydrolase
MTFPAINRKTISFFLSVLLSIVCLGGIFGCTPTNATVIPDQSNYNSKSEYFLIDWDNDANSKQEIIDFVRRVTTQGSDFVKVSDRIAVFDNDGTLWTERPNYFQGDFVEEAKTDSRLAVKKSDKEMEPTLGIDVDGDGTIDVDSEEIKIFLAAKAIFDGITTDEYINQAGDFLENTNHNDPLFSTEKDYGQRFDAKYVDLTYKPVIGLVNYLKANGFTVYICSGGGIDFIRSFAEDAYGIPPEKVIGSSVKTEYDETAGAGGNLVRQAMLAHWNDGKGKPVGIENHIGKRPIIAVGNSGGDFEMFQYTDTGVNHSLIVLINHDDCQREYKYNDVPGARDPETGEPLNESLDYAQDHHDNWIVASMKDDFKTIFKSNPSRKPPVCQ